MLGTLIRIPAKFSTEINAKLKSAYNLHLRDFDEIKSQIRHRLFIRVNSV